VAGPTAPGLLRRGRNASMSLEPSRRLTGRTLLTGGSNRSSQPVPRRAGRISRRCRRFTMLAGVWEQAVDLGNERSIWGMEPSLDFHGTGLR